MEANKTVQPDHGCTATSNDSHHNESSRGMCLLTWKGDEYAARVCVGESVDENKCMCMSVVICQLLVNCFTFQMIIFIVIRRSLSQNLQFHDYSS